MLNFIRSLLFPLGWLYHFSVQLRRFFVCAYRSSVPVICVGNITVGGTGKTPLVLYLAKYLQSNRKKVHILSRGYKGRLSYVQVDPVKHSSKDVGDEPFMLAQSGFTVWVGSNRARLAKMAEKAGADVLLMDDGFQNPTLKQDYSILVFDGGRGLGNGHCLPAGNLREFLSTAEYYADASIIMGDDVTGLSGRLSLPVFHGHVEPVSKLDLKKIYIAFAGIGRPAKFFDTLHGLGLQVIETLSYPDHYEYNEEDLQRMFKLADKYKAELVCTEKDWVKFPVSWQKKIGYLPIELKLKSEKKLLTEIDRLF